MGSGTKSCLAVSDEFAGACQIVAATVKTIMNDNGQHDVFIL